MKLHDEIYIDVRLLTRLEKYFKAYAQLFALSLNIHWRLIKVLEQTTASLSHITSSRGYLSYENK